MGITLDDLNAQRAMLKRGEEKRKADWQQAERERLRDTFAAAALTGLLSNITRYQLGVIAVQAYDIADEMLRERERHHIPDAGKMAEGPTNHDAAPEARAAEPESSVPLGSVAAPANTHTLTDAEREAIEWCRSLPMLDRDIVRMMPLRSILERMK